jgi:hypothetical protein
LNHASEGQGWTKDNNSRLGNPLPSAWPPDCVQFLHGALDTSLRHSQLSAIFKESWSGLDNAHRTSWAEETPVGLPKEHRASSDVRTASSFNMSYRSSAQKAR